MFERRAEKSRGALTSGREIESSAQLSFGDNEGTGVAIGISVDEIGAGDSKSEGVSFGRGIEDMGGLVCKPTSEVAIVGLSNESKGGSGTSTAVGVKKMSSSGSKSTCMPTSIWSLGAGTWCLHSS